MNQFLEQLQEIEIAEENLLTLAKVELQDEYKTVLTIPWSTLVKNSIFFEGLYASFKDSFSVLENKNNENIQIKINNVHRFLNLLEFMKGEVIVEELNHPVNFTSYICDIMYLGIVKLEWHILNMLEKMLDGDFWNRVTLLDIPYDILVRFLNEKPIQSYDQQKQINLFFFVLKWSNFHYLDDEETIKLLTFQSIESLNFEQVQCFSENYPSIFNKLVSASTLMATCLSQIQCQTCKQNYQNAISNTHTQYADNNNNNNNNMHALDYESAYNYDKHNNYNYCSLFQHGAPPIVVSGGKNFQEQIRLPIFAKKTNNNDSENNYNTNEGTSISTQGTTTSGQVQGYPIYMQYQGQIGEEEQFFDKF